MRFLIADDDRLNRTILVQYMKNYGEVEEAKDGMEVLELVMNSIETGNPYRALFLDIIMPRMDGIKVLKVVRSLEEKRGVAEEEHLPVIVMSALSDMEHVDQAFALGCDAYAAKPLELEKVEEVLCGLGILP